MNGTDPPTVVCALFPPDLRDQLLRSARENDRSISAELRQAVRAHLESFSAPPLRGPTGRGDSRPPRPAATLVREEA